MIEVENLSIKAGDFRLEGISFEIPAGGYGVLMGRTGCGKTTILEAICGLKEVTGGTIRLDGIDMTRMKAVGLADTQPKVPNRTPEGNPIPENMAQNRRVVVRVSPMSLEQQRQRQVGFEELLEESKRSGGVVSTPMNAPQGPMGLPNPDPEVRAREEQTLPPELRQQ